MRTPKIAVEDKGLLSYKSLILILTFILTYYLSQFATLGFDLPLWNKAYQKHHLDKGHGVANKHIC